MIIEMTEAIERLFDIFDLCLTLSIRIRRMIIGVADWIELRRKIAAIKWRTQAFLWTFFVSISNGTGLATVNCQSFGRLEDLALL